MAAGLSWREEVTHSLYQFYRKTLVLPRRKHDALVELLLRHRISLSFSALFWVSQRGEFIPFVSSFPGADVNQTDRWGVSPRTILNEHASAMMCVFFFFRILGGPWFFRDFRHVASFQVALLATWTVCWVYWVPEHLRIQLQLHLSCNCDQRVLTGSTVPRIEFSGEEVEFPRSGEKMPWALVKAKEVAVCASKRSVLNDRQLMVQRCFCFLGIGKRKGWFRAVSFSLDVGSTLWQRCSNKSSFK